MFPDLYESVVTQCYNLLHVSESAIFDKAVDCNTYFSFRRVTTVDSRTQTVLTVKSVKI